MLLYTEQLKPFQIKILHKKTYDNLTEYIELNQWFKIILLAKITIWLGFLGHFQISMSC